MATVSVVKLKVRRGTDAQRKLITLDQGELGFVTDSGLQRLFVGDGITKGGIAAGSKFIIASTGIAATSTGIQTGDLVYDPTNTTSQFWILTGNPATGALTTALSSYKGLNTTYNTGASTPISVGIPALTGYNFMASVNTATDNVYTVPAGRFFVPQLVTFTFDAFTGTPTTADTFPAITLFKSPGASNVQITGSINPANPGVVIKQNYFLNQTIASATIRPLLSGGESLSIKLTTAAAGSTMTGLSGKVIISGMLI